MILDLFNFFSNAHFNIDKMGAVQMSMPVLRYFSQVESFPVHDENGFGLGTYGLGEFSGFTMCG